MYYNHKEAAAHTGSRAAAQQQGDGLRRPAVAWPAIRPGTPAPVQMQPVIQRVGEEKLSVYDEKDADPVELEALKNALAQIRAAFKQQKTTYEDNQLANMPRTPNITGQPARQEREARINTVMTDYPDKLTSFDPIAALLATAPFTSGMLKLGNKDEHGDRLVTNHENRKVATLMSDEGSYLPDLIDDSTPEDKRTTYTRFDKPEKEYVADNINIPTRRYAYVEKSFYQFMEFLSIGSMGGRWQMLQQGMGRQANQLDVRDPEDGKEFTRHIRGQKEGPLSVQELAVLHNWKGSGLHQRGLSLTATPRVRAVYSNDGEPFSTTDGVRLKIDLAKVPKQVMLINHYTPLSNPHHLEGIQETVTGDAFKRAEDDPVRKAAKYNYKGSVIKNRELFLERLEPEWIVEIKFNNGANTLTPAQTPTGAADMHVAAGQAMGHGDYVQGFTKGVQDHVNGNEAQKPADLTSAEGKGWTSGQHYSTWYNKGQQYQQRENHWNSGITHAAANYKTVIIKNETLHEVRQKAAGLQGNAEYKNGALAFWEKAISLKIGIKVNQLQDNTKITAVPAAKQISDAKTAVTMPPGFEGLAKEESDAGIRVFDIQRLGWVHGYSGSQRKTTIGPDFYAKT